jgi:hypothetical protein
MWKVPGVLDWATMTHNPFVDITKDTTTLYASDRDVFLFLVDDTHPIEAGRLADGSPDLYFRGFYCWNSEVGSKTLGIASFYLRAVCMNRNLWGVENFEEITIRHSKFAAQRFAHEAAPALTSFANSSPAPFIAGIKAARERIVARSDEDRESFLRKRGFSKSETAKIIETVLSEEHRNPRAFSISCRASRRSPAARPIRTPASNWRARPGNCWSEPPDRTSRAAIDAARLTVCLEFQRQLNRQFPPIRKFGPAATARPPRSRSPRYARLAKSRNDIMTTTQTRLGVITTSIVIDDQRIRQFRLQTIRRATKTLHSDAVLRTVAR